MAKDKAHGDYSGEVSGIIEQNFKRAQRAMEDYLQFWQRTLAASPLANSELSKKMASIAQQNLAKSFDFTQRLTQARSIADLTRIQTEFIQSQLQSLTEQAKDLGEAVTNAVTKTVKSD